MPVIPTRVFVLLLTLWLGSFLVSPAMAQSTVDTPESTMAKDSVADTSSPRATLKSFIDGCNALHRRILEDRFVDRRTSDQSAIARKVLNCLDDSQLADFERLEAAGEAAVCIKEILDRVEIPPDSEIPDEDAKDDEGNPITQWRIPGTRITITQIESGPRRLEYLFSAGTIARAADYFQDIRATPYRTTGRETSPGFYDWYMTAPGHPVVASIVDLLPASCRYQTFGLANWKWIGVLLATIIAVFLMVLCYWFYSRSGGWFRETSLFRYCLMIVLPILAMLVPMSFRLFAYDYLTLRGDYLYKLSFAANLLTILASTVVVFGTCNRVASVIIASPQINPQGLDAQFIRIVSKLTSIIISAIVLLEGGRFLGIPVTTLLASAGVGGLAFALAAQDTLKNLFGTIMLLADKPFRVGERVVFGKYDGIVEEIGLRSTRIRLLSGHQATIPNDKLAAADIENVGRRPYIRRSAVLELPSSTPVAKVKRALAVVRTALSNHPGMEEERPPRVYLRDLNQGSVGVYFTYWYHPPEYWDFLEFSEKTNLQIMEQLEAEQIQFALPALKVSLPSEGDAT